ncbi:hypothetical protein Tco_1500408 [Tanacetum coccineum]
MSSECNNVKRAIRNDKYKVVCAMCKQCLITANHDVCVLNYVNGMNSRTDKHSANVSKTVNQKKHKPLVKKPKKVGSKERLASPKPKKPRSCLRWLPTERIFDLKGKIIESSESESQSDCSKRTVRFGNDHVAVILGYIDLQWGNILITRVYFPKGLGHNLFSVGQFFDLDLEVAFRRNTCFVINLEGVDLLKENSTTNLYTINLHEMAFASPICLMAHATSTKSKDEAPEVIKTFLKRITVLLQSPNDREDIGKLGAKGLDLTYAPSTITTQQPTEGELDTYAPSIITTQQPTKCELDLLFEAMYDDYIGGHPSATPRTVPASQAP